jgi:hypothetical protein
MPDQHQPDDTKPHMTTIAGRPAKVVSRLKSIDGVHVQCRLADGTDAFVLLSEIFRQFEQERARNIRDDRDE